MCVMNKIYEVLKLNNKRNISYINLYKKFSTFKKY